MARESDGWLCTRGGGVEFAQVAGIRTHACCHRARVLEGATTAPAPGLARRAHRRPTAALRENVPATALRRVCAHRARGGIGLRKGIPDQARVAWDGCRVDPPAEVASVSGGRQAQRKLDFAPSLPANATPLAVLRRGYRVRCPAERGGAARTASAGAVVAMRLAAHTSSSSNVGMVAWRP